LLGIVPALALGKVGRLSCLVLCHLVVFMLLALATAVRLAFFRYIYHLAVILREIMVMIMIGEGREE
jgi:hypothetical protein